MKLKEFNKNLKQEYQDTFQTSKPKRKFQFKLRYAFGVVFGCLFLIIIINHIYVQIYNSSAEAHNEAIKEKYFGKEQMSTSNLVQIMSPKDYEDIAKQYGSNYILKETKTSFLSTLFSLGVTGCTSGDKNVAPPIENDPSNSYQTNVQVEGIDEEDIAKCDGKYIYAIHTNSILAIYNLNGEKISSVPTNGDELLVYKNKIITLGQKGIVIYSFEEEKLQKEWDKSFDKFYTSRLKDNNLYVVMGFKNVKEEMDYDSCYYDRFSDMTWLQSILKIDLETLEVQQTQSITSSQVYCYMSDSAFYLASYTYFFTPFTTISMYNEELEPVGVMRVQGYLLNQFSMDEYEGYFRVVSTDNTQNAEELNRITIFSVKEELKETGCLKDGIGIGRQIVKSVRFDKTKCYVVTYEIKDPLYEIDCNDPTNPVIVSSYQAPGYSSYLHMFTVDDKTYILGLGYTDSLGSTKISLYENTTQIGKDFILSNSYFYDKPSFVGDIDIEMFSNHKALFFYQQNQTLYFGARVEYDSYIFFEIQVNQEEPIRIIKEMEIPSSRENYSRAFLVDENLYLTTADGLKVFSKE